MSPSSTPTPTARANWSPTTKSTSDLSAGPQGPALSVCLAGHEHCQQAAAQDHSGDYEGGVVEGGEGAVSLQDNADDGGAEGGADVASGVQHAGGGAGAVGGDGAHGFGGGGGDGEALADTNQHQGGHEGGGGGGSR